MSLLVFNHLYVVCPPLYPFLSCVTGHVACLNFTLTGPRPYQMVTGRFDTKLFRYKFIHLRCKQFHVLGLQNEDIHLKYVSCSLENYTGSEQNVCAISLLDFVSKRLVSYQRCQKVLRTMLDNTVVYQSGQHCNKTDTPATQIVLISFGFRNTSCHILPPQEMLRSIDLRMGKLSIQFSRQSDLAYRLLFHFISWGHENPPIHGNTL